MDWMTTKEASKMLCQKTNFLILDLIKQGKVKATRINKRVYLVSKSSLNSIIERGLNV